MEPKRPDPDALLKNLQEEEARAKRARLKIFFGMAPGVGKTYAMLQEARIRMAEGVDLVTGVVETHGRQDTMALTEGIPVLPKVRLPYRGTQMEEFDLAGALKRKPALILMDELAHTNVQGSLHAKRWQDVMDLLDAGIEVYTTVNVQHLESLKDTVAQITGVLVRESIPDTLLHRADQIELVDIPPEELQERLKEGKVYVPEQAQHAVERFFRKGNLLALRELALRRTAEHVDADMRRYMVSQGIVGKTWRRGTAAGVRQFQARLGHPDANSAHAYENPTPFTNFLQVILIFAIPAGLTYTSPHGRRYQARLGHLRRHGGHVPHRRLRLLWLRAGRGPHPDQTRPRKRHHCRASRRQHGGEGNPLRYRVFGLVRDRNHRRDCGAINSAHDSLTPLGGLVPMFNLQTDEVIFGGVGSGLYGMLLYAIVAVFIAGLMVGRTPEYLGKKISRRRSRWRCCRFWRHRS